MTQNELVQETDNGETGRPTAGGWTTKLVFRIILLILVGEFGFITYAFPNQVLSQIGTSYKTDQVAWVLSAFTLSSAALAPFLGRLADQFGKRRLLMVMVAAGIVGAFVVTFAPNFGFVIAGRAIQGVTLGLAFMNASLVRDIFPARVQAVAISLVVTGSGLLSIATSLASSWIITTFGWQGIFWVPAVYAIVVLVLVLIFVPESPVRAQARSLDIPGAILLGLGLAAVLIPISLGSTWGWTAPGTIGLFVVGILLLAGWLVEALRVKNPLIAIREFRYFPLAVAFWVSALGVASITSVYSYFSYIVLTPPKAGLGYGLGLTVATISLFSAMYSIGAFLGGFITGRALAKIPAPILVIAVNIVVIVGYLIASASLSNFTGFLISVLLIGLGGGGTYSVIYNLVARTVRPQRQASSAAAVTVGANVGGAVVPVVVFSILNANAVHVNGVALYTATLMHFALLVPVVLSAILLLLGIALVVYQRRRGGDLMQVE